MMKFCFFLGLMLAICPYQIEALLLKVDSIVISGSNPGSLQALRNMKIAENLEFEVNENEPLKKEIIDQINNNEKVKNFWKECDFVPVNLKIHEGKNNTTFNFDNPSEIVDKTAMDLNLQALVDNADKITLSVSVTKLNLD